MEHNHLTNGVKRVAYGTPPQATLYHQSHTRKSWWNSVPFGHSMGSPRPSSEHT